MPTARERMLTLSSLASPNAARDHFLSLTSGGSLPCGGDSFPVDELSANSVPENVDINVVEEIFSASKVEEEYSAIAVEEVIEVVLEEEVYEAAFASEVIEASIIKEETTASDDSETYRC